MNWYVRHAPIKLKMTIAFGFFVSLIVLMSIADFVLPAPYSSLVGIVSVLCALPFAWFFRREICGPYVATVVRMEALAAGDLNSTIHFTDYTECVGRMTKAMFTFRDAAAQQIALNKEAEANSQVVRSMTENMKELAKGDLTASVRIDFPPAYAEMKESFNASLDSLRRMIRAVIADTESIRAGSREIATASEDIARRTVSTAANLEETSAALSQIDSRLKASSVAAASTVHRADQAIATVGSGRATAEEAVVAMGRVSDSAKGIDSVIEGLDKIAFQTRVLAMNAAVEAGRAGDAGRGFAVVADLVSALAMRAEEEAKHARDQLTVTQHDIVTAVNAVKKVDGALNTISDDVTEVHKLLANMSEDNNAQSLAVTEISSAVSGMDIATQQNAAVVETTLATTTKLTKDVTALADSALAFKFEQRVQSVPVAFDRRRGPERRGERPDANRAAMTQAPTTLSRPPFNPPAAEMPAFH